MSLGLTDWLQEGRVRARIVVAGCVAVALLLVTLNALVDQLLVSAVLVGLGIPVLVLLMIGYDRTVRVVMVLGMFFAPLNSVRVGGPVTVADLLFVVGFMGLAPILLRRRLELSLLFVSGWVVMFVVGLLASVMAVNTAISFNHMLRFIAAAFVLPLAFMLWRPGRHLVVYMATAYLFGASLSVVYSVVGGGGTPRPIGLTTHPNFFGITAVLGAALVPYAVQYTRKNLRWAIWLAGLICVYGVWISGSRASFGALGAMVVVYTLIEGSVFMSLGMAAAAATGLLFFDKLAGDSNNALGRVLGGGSAQGSDLQRDQAFEVAVEAFRDRPIIGNGFENAMEAHSIYMQVLTSIGVIGIVGYALVLLAMAYPLFDAKRPNYRLAYPALTYALVGMFTNSLWDRFVWAALALSMVGVVIDNHEKGRGHVHHKTPLGAPFMLATRA